MAASSLRTRLGASTRRVYPRLDRDYWRFGRRRHRRAARALLAGELDRLRRHGTTRGRAPRLLVVPDLGPPAPTWQPAAGNIFFEVFQSAVEVLGEESVTLVGAVPGEPEHAWHRRLLTAIVDTGATHVIGQIEADPDSPSAWSWDVVAQGLADTWDGVLIGVMYDSAYEWLRIRARELGRLNDRLLIADLCVPMDGFAARGRFDVGPMTMPLSQASIAVIDEHVAGMPKLHDVTFIGTLYEYRVELMRPLLDHGFDVVINPHRPDAPKDSETELPRSSYLDYMAALAQSQLTVNFSLARGGPQEQYKIRVHEASLVGCLCLTDDRDRTRHFFEPDQYGSFETIEDMDRVVTALMSDVDALTRAQASARDRAHTLSRTDFWGRIDDGLARRGLPPLTGLRPPREPRSG